jgi:chaperonin cofactor prefoldin
LAVERTLALIKDAVDVETSKLKDELELSKKKEEIMERKIKWLEEQVEKLKTLMMMMNIDGICSNGGEVDR